MKVMRAATAAAIATAVLLALASCSPGGWGLPRVMAAQELRVILPVAPASWASLPDLRMSLAWRDPEGSLRSSAAEPGSSLRIEVERGFPQALVAQPSSSGMLLLPAGALYPEALVAQGSGRTDELRLDWRGGYAASIASELEGGGIDPSGFDLYSLVDEAIVRAEDPWLVSPLETARLLAEGDFRIDHYKKPKRFGFNLPGPEPWAPESPFASAPEGTAATVFVPEGLWRFVGRGKELFVSVDEKGRATFAGR
jgi:hypothetical protein